MLSTWRKGASGQTLSPPPPAKVEPLGEAPAIDPTTGWRISPTVAASLCIKPTPMLTPSEAAKVGALKEASPSFVVIRRLAMRFRGLLQGANPSNLDRFLHDARRSRLSSMQQFARTLTRDIEAVKHAIAEPWSSGQAEGQINRLKTLKRAMYGRASIELLRARKLPLEPGAPDDKERQRGEWLGQTSSWVNQLSGPATRQAQQRTTASPVRTWRLVNVGWKKMLESPAYLGSQLVAWPPIASHLDARRSEPFQQTRTALRFCESSVRVSALGPETAGSRPCPASKPAGLSLISERRSEQP